MVLAITKMRRDMRVLKRRVAHLSHRVSVSASDLSYDKQELAALERVLDILDAIDKKPWVLKELEN